ncbi:hypothetical protein LTR53_018377, partial [Teratosphaeriaceae sp. CCFEE 6253]
ITRVEDFEKPQHPTPEFSAGDDGGVATLEEAPADLARARQGKRKHNHCEAIDVHWQPKRSRARSRGDDWTADVTGAAPDAHKTAICDARGDGGVEDRKTSDIRSHVFTDHSAEAEG